MHKIQNFKSVREMLRFIQNMALECFEQFDTRLDKTPELRDWIISNICIQFKNRGVIGYFFKYSLNARKEIKDKIDNLALGFIGTFELSQLLNINNGDIYYSDNKFYISGRYDTKLKIEHFILHYLIISYIFKTVTLKILILKMK